MLWSLAFVPVAGALVAFAPPRRTRFSLALTAGVTLMLTFALSVVAATSRWTGTIEWSKSLRLTASLTPVSATVAILVPLIALAVLIYAAAHEERRGLTRLIGLLLVFVGGMELLVVADDFLTLLIGWELVGACSWALISHDWRDGANSQSGLYAFLTTRLGDLGLFVATMALFAASGSFAFAALRDVDGRTLQIVIFGVVVSAAAKSGQVPFSPWLFRAMAGPTSVSALLHAATMVAAGAYLLIRLQPFLGASADFSETVLVIGLVTAVAGGVVAVSQNHAKKLLAASTSAQFGLMFAAVGAGFPGVALFHLIAHAGFKALLFLAAGIAGKRAGTFALDRMRFGRTLPLVAAASAIGALALAGVPPLGGAWTKEAITSAVSEIGFWPIAGVLLAGALSAAYAARFQLLAYGADSRVRDVTKPRLGEYGGLALVTLCTLALSLLWLPAVRDAFARMLGAELPTSSVVDTLVSLLFVAAGLAAGFFLARRLPKLSRQGAALGAADWLGLPMLVRGLVTRPFERLAAVAARFDDVVIDSGPRGAAILARQVVHLLAGRDGETVPLARLSDGLGERLANTIPEGSALVIGFSGREARRLQTGLSHHYYMLLAVGAAITVVLLLLGS